MGLRDDSLSTRRERTHRRQGLCASPLRSSSASERSPEDAARVAELLVRAEVGGHPSHGLRRLPQYARGWREGTIVPAAQRRDRARRGLDADASTAARRSARSSAPLRPISQPSVRSAHGVAAIAVRHAGHCGRLADYADRACGRGVALLAFANDSGAEQTVAPPGGLAARLSTNPLAAGIPRAQRSAPRDRPRDERRGTAARCACWRTRAGRCPRPGCATALLQPLGGAKGFALALLVEALAGVVSGAGAVVREPGPDDQGVFLLAFDPARFGEPDELAERARRDARATSSTSRSSQGAEPLRVPGSGLPPLPLDPDARFELAPGAWRASRRWPASSASRSSSR